MGFRLDYEHPGKGDLPGSFVKGVDGAHWSRVPVIGEAISLRGLWVGRVAWVLWSLFEDDDVVIRVETQEGYEDAAPDRAALAADGWREA